jgi:hypothetical protein
MNTLSVFSAGNKIQTKHVRENSIWSNKLKCCWRPMSWVFEPPGMTLSYKGWSTKSTTTLLASTGTVNSRAHDTNQDVKSENCCCCCNSCWSPRTLDNGCCNTGQTHLSLNLPASRTRKWVEGGRKKVSTSLLPSKCYVSVSYGRRLLISTISVAGTSQKYCALFFIFVISSLDV